MIDYVIHSALVQGMFSSLTFDYITNNQQPIQTKTLDNADFRCVVKIIYYFCSCIRLQKPRKGLVGGCSLYEKGVYQTLCLLLFVISQITHNCKRTKTTVNVHGWYIITSRGLSYIYVTFHARNNIYLLRGLLRCPSLQLGQCESLEQWDG